MTTSSDHRALLAGVVLLVSTAAVSAASAQDAKPHRHGPGTKPHTHAVSKDEIVKRAKTERDRLIRERKLDIGWQQAAEPAIEEKDFNGRPEWVVTFRNPSPTDKAKEMLYIFLTPAGRFVAANHTGR